MVYGYLPIVHAGGFKVFESTPRVYGTSICLARADSKLLIPRHGLLRLHIREGGCATLRGLIFDTVDKVLKPSILFQLRSEVWDRRLVYGLIRFCRLWSLFPAQGGSVN